ncbi:PREDICTED: uncharacterized protein LOC108361699 [Rhagoletis zephyria]|uniref:uncharacterized protein LOC108361699 n=1 Tax=Rhagoletis zephyria TaxID=28612 RepID=UPI00081174DC|nr:PREDICTED: uncharacterized protein LOC108361699 [Rhagoletis zephyria]
MDIKQEGAGYQCVITRNFLFDKWLESRKSNTTWSTQANQILENIKCSWPYQGVEIIEFDPLNDRIYLVCKKLAEFWKENASRKNAIMRNHSSWLGKSETVFLSCRDEDYPSTSQQRGRPKKSFEECSSRSKRRRVAEISKSDESIATALRNSSCNSNLGEENTMSVMPCEVLALFVEAKFTKKQYLLVQNFVNTKMTKMHCLATKL